MSAAPDSRQGERPADGRHLREYDPERWAQMPRVERAAYDLGRMDATLLAARTVFGDPS